MPLYEYRCTECGNRFEKIQSFSAEPERECPKCHGPLIRPLTAPAFQFKGAGWYVNDYASKGSAQASESPSESKAEKPSDSKKAAAKTEGAATSSPPASTSSSDSAKSSSTA